ncbi:hypothetical protein ACTOJ1_000954 [Shigella flexneri]
MKNNKKYKKSLDSNNRNDNKFDFSVLKKEKYNNLINVKRKCNLTLLNIVFKYVVMLASNISYKEFYPIKHLGRRDLINNYNLSLEEDMHGNSNGDYSRVTENYLERKYNLKRLNKISQISQCIDEIFYIALLELKINENYNIVKKDLFEVEQEVKCLDYEKNIVKELLDYVIKDISPKIKAKKIIFDPEALNIYYKNRRRVIDFIVDDTIFKVVISKNGMIPQSDISNLLIWNKENNVLEDLLVAENIKKIGIYLPLQNKIHKWNLECFHNDNYDGDDIEIFYDLLKEINTIVEDYSEEH